MGRKPKFDAITKIEAVDNYLNGKESISEIIGRLSIFRSTLYKWIDKYKFNGAAAFDMSSKNKSYSKELKQNAINDILNGNGSYQDISLKYGITSDSILLNWVKKYNNHIETKAYKPYDKDGIYMSKDRKFTYEEKIEVAQWVLDNNDDYAQAAIKFDVSYNNAYTWSKKLLDHGKEGLKDNRGRKRSDEELSEIEKLERKIEVLERKLSRSEMEKEVLKKLDEIERSVLASNQRKK